MFRKEFWKYFKDTYKSAKWLVVRYLIVAVYLTVSSIIANKMSLNNLTYFNAIIGLATFGNLLSFGISNGVGIFINQNIHNKDKVSYYTKVGMYLNFVFSFICVIMLLVFINRFCMVCWDLSKQLTTRFIS